MYIFVIANQKGGVGKTTTGVSVGAALARNGHRVLILDNDPQGHIAKSFGVPEGRGGGTTALYLDRKTTLADTIQPSGNGQRTYLALVAADARLAEAERDASNDLSGGLYRLADRMDEFSEAGYDALIVDCPPNLGALALNSFLLAANLINEGHRGGIVVPVSMGMLDVDGLGRLSRSIEGLHGRGLAPPILALVPTMCEPQTIITRDILDVLSAQYGERVTRPVRKSVRFREAPALGQTIFEYDPDGNGANDYAQVAEDLVRLAEQA